MVHVIPPDKKDTAETFIGERLEFAVGICCYLSSLRAIKNCFYIFDESSDLVFGGK
jgi:hypothetical protein